MSARTYYVHPGTGKTGPSAIQYALTGARGMLKANDYVYPDASENFHSVQRPRSHIFDAMQRIRIV
jgi:hypothetical protein